jgi:hypothetical protein
MVVNRENYLRYNKNNVNYIIRIRIRRKLMIVYHGSHCVVENPILLPKQRLLDFGPGFYTTTNKEQAIDFAIKVRERESSDKCCVNMFEVDIDKIRTELKILEFKLPDEQWLDFVADNRNGKYRGENYDIIYGPVANDKVYRVFIAYEAGIYNKKETLKKLKVQKLYNQITFKTQKALSNLKYIGRFECTDGGCYE